MTVTISMKIGCLQIRSITGDPFANAKRIVQGYERLVKEGAELVITPELALPGYNARDLFYRTDFIETVQTATTELQKHIGSIPLILGTALPRKSRNGGKPLYNAALLLEKGEVKATTHKMLLPSYDVFEETRYFEPGEKISIWKIANRSIAVTICEDVWHQETRVYSQTNPIHSITNHSIDLLLNLSASPWHSGKEWIREKLLSDVTSRCKSPILWINTVGGYDDILYDGQSLWLSAEGKKQAQGASFEEEEILWDLNSSPSNQKIHRMPACDISETDYQKIFDALIMGTRDYVHQSGFKQVLLGLSGGIDSALVACIAAHALGPEKVWAIGMPSRYSSASSLSDAEKLISHLGIKWSILPIEEIVEHFSNQMEGMLQASLEDVTAQNVQARMRGLMLMTLSNQTGRLLLTTGNKSELSVGYCTLYGDMCGGLAPIGDLLKTEVYQLARWINRKREIIPWNTIEKPPSAELKPNQTDQDTLPPYETLDLILRAWIVDLKSIHAISKEYNLPLELVQDITRRVRMSEYKRQQAAVILKVSRCAFGFGRHHLITQKGLS